jgi:hypothetical protein
MRATGMPDWMVRMAALQQASTDGNGQTPDAIASGIPDSLSVSEEQAGVAQMFVERLARDPRLHHAVEVLGVHRDHPVHVAEVDRDAAERRVDVALERGADAERDHRHAMRGAHAHDLLHVLGRLRKHHRVRRLVRDPGGGVGVLLAHRPRGHQPVAKPRGERMHDRHDPIRVAAAGRLGSKWYHRSSVPAPQDLRQKGINIPTRSR